MEAAVLKRARRKAHESMGEEPLALTPLGAANMMVSAFDVGANLQTLQAFVVVASDIELQASFETADQNEQA